MSIEQDLFDECVKCDTIKFGDFVLKSGRQCNYFFNSGELCTSRGFSLLCEGYAKVINDALSEGSMQPFDVVFGPAYKGIPLCTSVVGILGSKYGRDCKWMYNRKENKDHGEGGMLVGGFAELRRGKECKVLMIDDVISSGTAVNEALELLESFAKEEKVESATVVGVAVAFDREEVPLDRTSDLTTLKVLEVKLGAKCVSVLCLSRLLEYMRKRVAADAKTAAIDNITSERIESIVSYRKRYGGQ